MDFTDHEIKAMAQSTAKLGPKAGDEYKHYKGGVYRVVARPLDEATLEPLVIYRSYAYGTEWSRPLSVFLEPIEVGGKMVPRFCPYGSTPARDSVDVERLVARVATIQQADKELNRGAVEDEPGAVEIDLGWLSKRIAKEYPGGVEGLKPLAKILRNAALFLDAIRPTVEKIESEGGAKAKVGNNVPKPEGAPKASDGNIVPKPGDDHEEAAEAKTEDDLAFRDGPDFY